jgi:23S rRNA pseudouridine1911/1915/1917 synthase
MQSERIVVQVRERVRLDVFLTRRLAHVSRNRIQRHIAAGDVLVDGRRVRPSHLLVGGEVLEMPPFAARHLDRASGPMALDIRYEDEDLLVVDKPAGVLVHPVGGEFQHTLLNGLHHHLVQRGEDARELGIVHRLDRLTSGLLVVAKSLAARRELSQAVEERRVHRAYVGLAAGVASEPRGTIDLFIRRHPSRPTRMQALDAAGAAAARRAMVREHVSASGYSDPRLDGRPRRARTHWRVLRRLPGATLLRLELDTGRTHQIRVHLQGIGMPLLGDPLYGPEAPEALSPGARSVHQQLGRPALHAAVLAFVHPRTGVMLRLRAPLPADLHAALTELVRARP